MNNSCDDIRRAVHILLIDDTALRLTQALHDDLLCRLCGNAPKVRGSHLDLDHVADGIIRVDGTRLSERNVGNVVLRFLDDRLDGKDVKRTRLTRQSDADVLRRAEVAPVCRDQRRLDGLKEKFLIDALLVREIFQPLKELLVAVLLPCDFSCQDPNPP